MVILLDHVPRTKTLKYKVNVNVGNADLPNKNTVTTSTLI